MNTMSMHKNYGLLGSPAMPASRSSPGCRYPGAPGRRIGAGPPRCWDLGPAVRKGALS